jgi:hypothetical protein
MPLLITPATSFLTSVGLLSPQAYAIILKVGYDAYEKVIRLEVGYFASEQAYFDKCKVLEVKGLPTGFSQPATAEEADAVPIFQFLEGIVAQQLLALLGSDTRIQTVP